MKRRTAILGLGGLVAGGGAAMGTSAFSSVEATRQTSVTIADDTDAYLALEPARSEDNNTPLAQDDPYSVIDENSGRLELNVTALNVDATTVIPDVFEIRNEGVDGREVTVFIEQEGERTDVLEFFTLDENDERVSLSESEGFENFESGEHITVSIEADTDGIEPGDEIIESIVINATNRGEN